MSAPIDYAMRGNKLMHSVNNSMAKHEQIQNLSRIGAEQLAKFGPEGEAWAKRLVENPRAALQMADEYGGLGAIEQRLRGGIASQKAVESGYLAPAEGDLFEAYGAKDGSSVIQSAASRAAARARVMSALAASQPEGLKGEDFRNIANKRTKVTEDFDQLFIAHKMANAADVDSPEWGQALTILFNKVLQPNSAVLQGEADATAQSMQSLLEELGVTVKGIFQPRAPLSREGRVRITKMMNELAAVGMKEYRQKHAGWQRVNRDMQIAPNSPRDFQTRPGYERLGDVSAALGETASTISELAGQTTGGRSVDPILAQELEARKKVTLPDGRVMVMVGPNEWEEQ